MPYIVLWSRCCVLCCGLAEACHTSPCVKHWGMLCSSATWHVVRRMLLCHGCGKACHVVPRVVPCIACWDVACCHVSCVAPWGVTCHGHIGCRTLYLACWDVSTCHTWGVYRIGVALDCAVWSACHAMHRAPGHNVPCWGMSRGACVVLWTHVVPWLHVAGITVTWKGSEGGVQTKSEALKKEKKT